MIKEVIVVEGKQDTRRLKEIFGSIHTIETRGSAIDASILDAIKKAQETKGVIIFTDPDYPGQRIRHIIDQAVPGCKHAYIEKKKAIDTQKKKVGVEHCSDDDIIQALSSLTKTEVLSSSNVTFSDLMDLGLVGGPESKALRDYMSLQLNIGYNNAKQFYRKIQWFNVQLDTLITLKKQYKDGNR